MAASSAEYQRLLRVLEARGLPFGEDDVAWAFESNKYHIPAHEWVQRYLNSPTLLTTDELAFHEKNGLPCLKSNSSPGRSLADHEVEAAIESLRSSTAAIEKQILIMEQQKRALQKLQSQNATTESALAIQDRRQAKLALEKATLDLEIDQMSQSTGSHLRSSIKQVEATSGSLSAGVDRLLEKDDRLLDGLQKLLPKISENSLDSTEASQVEQLCSMLTTMAVKEIHARLDKVYKESLLEYGRRPAPEKGLSEQQTKQMETQRIELEELGGEIDGLVAIVVDNQHRKPMKQGLLTHRAESQSQKSKWAEYTVTALAYLISRLDAVSDHIQKLQAHGGALRAVNRTFDEIIVAAGHTAPGAAKPMIQNPDRNAAKGLKPLRLVQANMSDAQDPALTFLRDHDVRVSESDGLAKLPDILETSASDRASKLYNLSRSTEDTISVALIESLAKADADLHDLLNAAHTYSDFGTASTVDHSVQRRLLQLDRQTKQLAGAMRSLNIDEISRSVRSKQNEVLAKFSGAI